MRYVKTPCGKCQFLEILKTLRGGAPTASDSIVFQPADMMVAGESVLYGRVHSDFLGSYGKCSFQLQCSDRLFSVRGSPAPYLPNLRRRAKYGWMKWKFILYGRLPCKIEHTARYYYVCILIH